MYQKKEFETLETTVGGKLDIEPMHKHHIEDIKQLQSSLDSKYDKGEKYSYNVILSDTEKIPYLEAPKMKSMEVIRSVGTDESYKFYVDETNGDLMICSDDILLANYSKSSNNWSFGGVSLDNIPNVSAVNTEINNLKIADSNINLALSEHDERITANTSNINTVESIINELRAANETFIAYIAKTDAILKNHYDVLVEL